MFMPDVIHTSRSTRMFYLTKYALVVVLIYVPSGTFGKVSLEPVELKTISSITCRSDVDIKIEFIGETDGKRLTIAECKPSQETCYLHDRSFVKQYAVSYTGDGALFYIVNDVEETRGTYLFCEIYPPVDSLDVKEKINSPLKNSTKNDCVKEKITSPLKNSTKNNTVENNLTCAKYCSDNSANKSGLIAAIILLACALCVAIFYILKLKQVLTCLGCSELQDRTTRLTYTVTQEESREDGEIPLMINRDNVHAEQDITIDSGTTTLDQLNEYFTSQTLQRTTHQSNPVPTTLASPLHKESNGIDTSDVSSCSDEEFKRLSKENWFFGVLPRKEIEPLLTQDGDFLVRGSTNNPTDSKYVLSVFWKGPPPQHIKIIKKENGWYFQGDVFKTIIELVNYYLKNKKPIEGTSGVILSNPIQRDSWQLRNSHITLRSNIGDNQFYEVFLGYYTRSVAVRKCKDTSSAEQRKVFLGNGLKLKQFDHPNVVKFLGIVAQREPVMIIMEYMPGGSLLKYLNENGQKQSRLQAAIMCLDAASGMAYLSEKGYIYRELSAKKCLVGYRRVVKISPFVTNGEDGEYAMTLENRKWTAPEAAKFGTCTPMSDVWSFGVLMWEILSNGSEPYHGYSDCQTLEKIEEGYRMPAPQNTPDSIYQLMLKCWKKTPSSRITFQQMQKRLVTLINNPPSREKWS